MNHYKLLCVNNGYVQVVYVQASDIASAAYQAGVGVDGVIKIELIGSETINDLRPIKSDY